MSMTRPPGGGRFNEETRQMALVFMTVFLVIFFLLVLRLWFDKKEGHKLPLKPTSATTAIRSVLGR